MLDFSARHVLVTGGAGFIGSHLVDALVAAGARVRVLDDLSTGKIDNLAHHADSVDLVEGDIRDTEACARACREVELVFHHAAVGSVPASMDDPARAIAINVTGTANVFGAAHAAGARRVVFASSSAVYGDSTAVPAREDRIGAPLSPYAVSKWMNEELAQVFARCYGMSLIGLRYFNVYGQRQDPNGPYAAVVPKFFAAYAAGAPPSIFGDGTQTRDFIHVSDVVRANLLAASADVGGAHALNVGADVQTTVLELAHTIREIMGAEAPPAHAPMRPGDIEHSRADIQRARKMLGFEPSLSLAEGLSRTKPLSATPPTRGRM